MFHRNFELPGKSAALGQNGMVATSHPRATLAGLDVLRDGGNAIDAAVCAAAVQAVVEPTQTGIGGDCFALFMREGDSAPSALNGSGWTPEAATLDWYRRRAFNEIGVETPHAVTVPGAVAAWERLITDHGRLAWDRVLSPAIEAAEMGTCIPERLARDWGKQVEKLQRNATTARLFLFDGKAPLPGQVHRQPQLGKTLRQIARSGASAFYNGPLAAAMISTLRAHGGLHADEDFASFASEYVQPISVAYRGYDLWECPPNGQGIIPMLIAKGLERFDLSAWASISVERFHVMAELARQAYAERDLYVADPRTSENVVDWLLSHDHVRFLRSHVSLDRRIADVGPVLQRPHRDTVFIAVVDRDRMAVSLINSLFEDFGTGIVCEETGVLFHNRASSFVLEDGHPNCIAGRKRPMHTIIPAIVTKDGNSVMPFGVTGAHFQPFGQVQILTNVIDYGMPIQAAIDHPRIFARGDIFEIERAVPKNVVTGLQRLGHRVTRPENPLGTAQAIWIDRGTGVLHGGADGRRDGLALGY